MPKLFIFSSWFILCALLLSSSSGHLEANANAQQPNLPVNAENTACPDILAIATTQARDAYNLSLNAQTAAE